MKVATASGMPVGYRFVARAAVTKQAPLLVAVLVVTTGAACTTTSRQGAAGHSIAEPSHGAAAAYHAPWRPKHQGGADLSTGYYLREDDDLVIDTPMPIVLRRTHNSADTISRQFGVGAMHPGEIWIHGDSDPRIPWGELILATGRRIRFARISAGDTQEGAVLRHDSTPTEYNGALLRWTGALWEMRFTDGATASFLDCPRDPAVCSLVERRDADGHRIAYVRDQSGTLLRMESEGQSIGFEYDLHKRIVRAYDTRHREVRYTYDDRGRLIRAAGRGGDVRSYGYDDHDRMNEVREPGRIVQNWYDAAGRWTRQIVKDSDQDPDPYVATAQYVVEGGSVVESDFDEGADRRVRRYNAQHYTVSETLAAGTSYAVVLSYLRDDSNAVTGVTLSCAGADGPVTRSVPREATSDRARYALVRETCQPPPGR
jgi:YD repeat-containing protein